MTQNQSFNNNLNGLNFMSRTNTPPAIAARVQALLQSVRGQAQNTGGQSQNPTNNAVISLQQWLQQNP
jgi:hypothetical protein